MVLRVRSADAARREAEEGVDVGTGRVTDCCNWGYDSNQVPKPTDLVPICQDCLDDLHRLSRFVHEYDGMFIVQIPARSTTPEPSGASVEP